MIKRPNKIYATLSTVRELTELERAPAYGVTEASAYLRLQTWKTRRWAEALCTSATEQVFPLSFGNLLELHVLKAMRLTHRVSMPRIRRAVATLQQLYGTEFPLLTQDFWTDGVDILMREKDGILNLSRSGQHAIQEAILLYARRIEVDSRMARLYPFMSATTADEPRSIVISPSLSFGRPVIAGTGISTEVVADRFNARETVIDLAAEYELDTWKIEEAIRWELTRQDAA